jgi:hypothetical protein
VAVVRKLMAADRQLAAGKDTATKLSPSPCSVSRA